MTSFSQPLLCIVFSIFCISWSFQQDVSTSAFVIKICTCVRKHKLSILHGKQINLNATIGTVSLVINSVKPFRSGIIYLVWRATDWNFKWGLHSRGHGRPLAMPVIQHFEHWTIWWIYLTLGVRGLMNIVSFAKCKRLRWATVYHCLSNNEDTYQTTIQGAWF